MKTASLRTDLLVDVIWTGTFRPRRNPERKLTGRVSEPVNMVLSMVGSRRKTLNIIGILIGS